MSEDKITSAVEEAMNPETFDVLAYVEEQPVAKDTVTVYVDTNKTKQLYKLIADRKQLLTERKQEMARGKASSLGLADEDEDTEYDNEINALVADLEKSALTFELQTVAPKLVKSIEQHYKATVPKDSDEAVEQHSQKMTADILSRAIVSVTRGDGAKGSTEWDADRLLEFEKTLYPEQASRLVSALYDIVHIGYIFDEALTADFS